MANSGAPSNNPNEEGNADEKQDDGLEKVSGDDLMRLLIRENRMNAKKAVEKPAPAEKEKAKGEAKTEQPEQEQDARKSMRERFAAIIAKERELVEKMASIRRKMENKELMDELKENTSPEALEQWKKRTLLLEQEEFNTTQEKMFLEGLSGFWEGDTPPAEFTLERGEYLNNLPYGYAEQGKALNNAIEIQREALGIPDVQTAEEWRTINQSTRLAYIDSVIRDVRLDDWMSAIEKQNTSIEETLENELKNVTSVEKMTGQIVQPSEIEESTSFISTIRGTRFYSINDYIKGAQKYWSALKSTWEQRGDRYSSVIARKLGKALQPVDIWPFYGQEVARVLDHQLDSKNDEETKQTHDMLEHEGANWEHLFANNSHHKGEFWQFAYNNPNKARGVIEFAADHGFLYDLDDDIGNAAHPIFGVPLAQICSDWSDDPVRISNYYTLLRGKNSAGRDKEVKDGYDKDVDTDNVPRFIELIESEMDDFNLWSTVGICKRALERGLWSEIAAWVTTTIMNKLREHPELRKHTPQIFFDLVGKLSMYNTAFTAGWLKAHRKTLREWAKTGNEHVLDDTEIHTFTDIENEIKEKNPHTDYSTKKGIQELNHRTAEVLAGRIVKLPGGYIHIYESRFKKYRDGAADTFQSLADPHKEDSDYANQITEKSMLPQVAVDKVLKYSSTMEFTPGDWISGYFHSFVEQAKQLKAIPELKDAYENFCNEVREKMDHYFKGHIMSEERGVRKQLGLMDGKIPSLAAMTAENLISWDLMKKCAAPQLLIEQLTDPRYPQFHDFAISKGLMSAKSKGFMGASPKPSTSGAVSGTPLNTAA